MTAIAPPVSSPGLLVTTVARKVIMALTGVVLTGFVLIHMIGNLLLYQGPEALNHYGELLQSKPPLVWTARLVLLACVALHIWAATTLTLANWAARPVGYRKTAYEASTYASRTMRWGGPLLLLFIVYHLLHFTVGSVHPDFVRGDVYHNVVVGFQNPLVAFFYALSMVALSLHLFHGVESMLQTMGLSHPKYNGLRKVIGVAYAAVVAVGNLSFPLSVFFGLVR
ncbi:MAG TPA: succinate dehydrogenase cytochrome b subunit [Vicinamibacteria bacterium]|nr:succinate dehydrogenase cytochrome b subunit [Vicinamibacteria bacterium]HRB11388.1 succinate dehydrogenase cytochrome b subunit [Vicinamibacteria bacterium]